MHCRKGELKSNGSGTVESGAAGGAGRGKQMEGQRATAAGAEAEANAARRRRRESAKRRRHLWRAKWGQSGERISFIIDFLLVETLLVATFLV